MIPNTAVASDVSVNAGTAKPYVDWGAISGGAFIAVSISSVFLAFGSALGLSLASFQSGSATSVTGLVIAAGLWLLWVQVSSFAGGGYLAGRMRRRIGDATPHEVEMRDGAHGLLVWAVGVSLGAVVAAWLAMAGASGLATVAGQAASNPNAVEYYVDRLMRADPAAPVAAPDTSSTGASDRSQAQSQQIARVLTMSLGATKLDDSDRSFLAREVTARTGLPQAEAEKRVDETVATLKAQADKARRYGILFAFLAAASLLISATAAWWAACTGGRHRDEGVDHSHLTRWR